MFASSYGWEKNAVLDCVYPEEVPAYRYRIVKRMINDYRMQLAIVNNPHLKEPGKLLEKIEEMESKLEGGDYLSGQLDKEGVAKLKKKIQGISKNILVK